MPLARPNKPGIPSKGIDTERLCIHHTVIRRRISLLGQDFPQVKCHPLAIAVDVFIVKCLHKYGDTFHNKHDYMGFSPFLKTCTLVTFHSKLPKLPIWIWPSCD